MARPKKDNADYFSHDSGMRDDARIKAVRRKYSHLGYSIWNMLLEHLTNCDFFEYEYNDLNIELLAGDFDIKPDDLKEIIDYFIKLKLIQNDNGFIKSNQLIKRFETLLSKRKRDRNRVIASENPQSKVKESKVKEIKNSYSESDFLKDWKKVRENKTNQTTNINKLTQYELNDFNTLKKEFTKQQFQDAMLGLFEQKNMFPANKLRPTHFLRDRNIEKYLDCKTNNKQLFEEKQMKL